MNLESKISSSLWQAIESNYDGGNYTSAILDSLYFLADKIREKTGLETDGIALIGHALGGNSPKLKLNKFQTENEKNIQRGMESILRGIFQGIRNPRSHRKHSDGIDSADPIIYFIDYLYRQIEKSKSKFSKSDFLGRILDPDFVEQETYAQILAKEIPSKLRYEVMIEIFRRKEETSWDKLKYICNAIHKKMTATERKDFATEVSNELRTTQDNDTIIYSVKMYSKTIWKKLDTDVKMRIENKLIKSIESGRYSKKSDKCLSGALGTYYSNIRDNSIMKDDLLLVLINKLDSFDENEVEYVSKYFSTTLGDLSSNSPQYYIKKLRTIFSMNLKLGDKLYYDLVISFGQYHKILNDKLKGEIENFVEEDDDLPF